MTSGQVTSPDKPKCNAIKTDAGMRRRRCNRNATGPDGLCGHCRNILTPRPTYLCRACGTSVRRGVDGDACAEHKRTA